MGGAKRSARVPSSTHSARAFRSGPAHRAHCSGFGGAETVSGAKRMHTLPSPTHSARSFSTGPAHRARGRGPGGGVGGRDPGGRAVPAPPTPL